MRLNGARLRRDVWVNSLSLMDRNLLELADGVTIGSDAHVAGHVVEHGILKTAPVTLGRNTLIGISRVVGIGVESGADVQVGALSVVPKFTYLEAGRYAAACQSCGCAELAKAASANANGNGQLPEHGGH